MHSKEANLSEVKAIATFLVEDAGKILKEEFDKITMEFPLDHLAG